MGRPTNWALGLTTVESRLSTLLPQTLASIEAAGFERPRLFVDGVTPAEWAARTEFSGCEATLRTPHIRTYGNWVLALAELYIRWPHADRYVIFQDDFVASRNLRSYLERCQYPLKGYWNLYTFRDNEQLIAGKPVGWHQSNQFGRGAVGLVFDRAAVQALLIHQDMIERPLDLSRGWRAVDGGVVTAMKKAGWVEYVHNPSLIQHTGKVTSMGNRPHLEAQTFRGESFDCMELLSAG